MKTLLDTLKNLIHSNSTYLKQTEEITLTT